MPALGQKQTCAVQNGMSALPPRADMCDATGDVRFGPIADINLRVGKPQGVQLKGRSRHGADGFNQSGHMECAIQPDRPLSERRLDEVELGVEGRTDRIDRANDHHRNAGSNQTIFNRGSCRLVL